MDDLTMTRLCAEAMGIKVQLIAEPHFHYPDCPFYCIPGTHEGPNPKYDPLHNKEQCFDLVEKLGICIACDKGAAATHRWEAWPDGGPIGLTVFNADLNRAIVECAAKLRAREK